jgi:uracil phosphoribosyltransferase
MIASVLRIALRGSKQLTTVPHAAKCGRLALGAALAAGTAMGASLAEPARDPPVAPPIDPVTQYSLMRECPSFRLMPQTLQLTALMTKLRDEKTSDEEFVFYADRIIRLLVEAGLEEMPKFTKRVLTPTGVLYDGVSTMDYRDNVCGVSIVRAGESMEAGLRDCCKGIKIGKILIQRDEETALPTLYYSKFPPGIDKHTVLLLDPMLATGGSAIKAIDVLVDRGIPQEKIVFINLICCPEGIRAMNAAYPQVRIVSAALDSHLNEKRYIIPGLGDFGDRYFGTT